MILEMTSQRDIPAVFIDFDDYQASPGRQAVSMRD